MSTIEESNKRRQIEEIEEQPESKRAKTVDVPTYKEELAEKLTDEVVKKEFWDSVKDENELEDQDIYSTYMYHRYGSSCLISKRLFAFFQTAGEDIQQEIRDLLYNYIQGRYFDSDCELSSENPNLALLIAKASFKELEQHVVDEKF